VWRPYSTNVDSALVIERVSEAIRFGQHAVPRSLAVKREAHFALADLDHPTLDPVNESAGRSGPSPRQGRGRLAGSDFARTGGRKLLVLLLVLASELDQLSDFPG
jgi:hypothetical protein